MKLDLDKAEQFYDHNVKKYLLGDLKKSRLAKTNYLTALGCLVGTEMIGRLIPKLEKEKGSLRSKHFNRCLYRLSSGTYLEGLDKAFMKSTRKGIYDHLRHNMAHIFTPMLSSRLKDGKVVFIPITVAQKIILTDKYGKKSGPPIYYDQNRNLLAISIEEYEKQLVELVDFAYKKTFDEKDEEYVIAALDGIKHIYKGF